jgi:rod shape-determining protein MreD
MVNPLAYIYFIFILPFSMNRNLVMLLSFILGYSIDAFSYTLGMHAMAATIAGFSRSYSLNLFVPKDVPNEYVPSVRTLGFVSYLKYAGFIVFLHHFVYFLIESLSLLDPINLLLRIVGSFFLTMIVILAFEGINSDIFKK